ncbi:MAG: baeRF7 domain-containing protein [Thainema sp.]
MALLTKSELQTLAEMQAEPCISIYMPTHIAGPEIRQDPIRFKNRLNEARERLEQAGLNSDDVNPLLDRAQQLTEQMEFWRHQKEGLALFIAPNFFRLYRLPLEFEEKTIVSDRIHLKPLMPMLSGDGYFYLLSLSQNRVQLFQGTHYTISEIDPDDMPRSLAEALQYDDPEKQLQFHNVSGDGSSLYHGHGVGTTQDKTNILRFCQKLDSSLSSFLNNETAPLIIAGVEYLHPIYREANSYPHLLEQGVIGNPEHLKPEELHQNAWQVVQPYFHQAQEHAFSTYRDLLTKPESSSDVADVVKAAYDRQIDTLFVRADQHCWGQFNPQTHAVQLHNQEQAEDTDLLDFAAVQTFLNGGKVFAVDTDEAMPADEPVAAILRFVA